MSLVSSYGTGRALATIRDLSLVERRHRSGGIAAIFCHGSGQGPASPVTPAYPGQAAICREVAREMPMASIDAGESWGNDTAISRTGNARTWAQSSLGATAGPVALIGVSMGALTALNYAKANPANVSRLALILPVVDLNDVHANNRGGTAAAINAAYGGSYVEATERADHNPAYWITQGTPLAGIEVAIWYAPDDTICTAASVTAFASASGAEITSVGNLGHSEEAVEAVDPADVLAFLTEAVS